VRATRTLEHLGKNEISATSGGDYGVETQDEGEAGENENENEDADKNPKQKKNKADDLDETRKSKRKAEFKGYAQPDEDEREMFSDSDDDLADDSENPTKPQPQSVEEDWKLWEDQKEKNKTSALKLNTENGKLYFSFTIHTPLQSRKILMLGIVEKVATDFVLKSCPGINRCFIQEVKAKDKSVTYFVQTEGANIIGLTNYLDLVDMTKVGTNDIYSILQTYGVEAARASIVKEINTVFAVYGISVDYRHLGLIADYMTFEGGFKAFNRHTIASNPSPLQKTCFETSADFLSKSTIFGDHDLMDSPSARIALGRPIKNGTGSFELLAPLVNSK